MPLNDIFLMQLGYFPDGPCLWTTNEPFVTVHQMNGKYIFSATGKELTNVSDLKKEYFKFTNKKLD